MIELKNIKPPEGELKTALDTCWSKVLSRSEVGFTRIPELNAEWKAVEDRVQASRPARRVLVLGIGGSSLGTQVIYEGLRAQRPVQMTFLESPDPDTWAHLRGLTDPEWRDKHVVIVSKSGNTLETLSWVERLNAHEPNWMKSSQVTVVASPGAGALQQWAAAEKVETLWIPENVGGRFSVLTAAGMLPAGLMGCKPAEFREGASWALKRTDLMNALTAAILQSWERGEWITQMWSYSESMKVFGEWWQQLWGESLAKRNAREGLPAPRASTPMSCRGPRDQHSLVQQLLEGARDKFVFVNRVRAVENVPDSFRPSLFPTMPFHGRQASLGKVLGAEAQAFEKALAEAKLPFAAISIESLNERSLGALFMMWQMVIAQLGEFMNINAFDQPGVESGKKFANEILKH
jgi:glucose-6-phosphate isomerase